MCAFWESTCKIPSTANGWKSTPSQALPFNKADGLSGRLLRRFLRNRQGVSFANGCGRLSSLRAINHNQNFVGADGRVSTQGAVSYNQRKNAIAHPAAKKVGHIHGFPLHAVVGANNSNSVPFIPVAAFVICRAVAPIIPIVTILAATIEQTDIHESALVEVEFTFFIAPISCENAQRLVFPYGGIPAPGLVIHCDSAVHPAASDEIFENIGDVIAVVPESVVDRKSVV